MSSIMTILGTLPLGFTAAATLHSSTSHKIKPPPSYASPNTINNMEQVFKELCKFVKVNSKTLIFKVLFTMFFFLRNIWIKIQLIR